MHIAEPFIPEPSQVQVGIPQRIRRRSQPNDTIANGDRLAELFVPFEVGGQATQGRNVAWHLAGQPRQHADGTPKVVEVLGLKLRRTKPQGCRPFFGGAGSGRGQCVTEHFKLSPPNQHVFQMGRSCAVTRCQLQCAFEVRHRAIPIA